MRIAVVTTNNVSFYSGGRYSTLVMAECLAVHHDVYYITNNKPVFYEDFSGYPHHQSIHLCLTGNFADNLPVVDFDIVILVPTSNPDPSFYLKARIFAIERNAKLALLNFETPNWFNSLCPGKKKTGYWKNWKNACRYGCLVISISKEGNRFAKEYYTRPAGKIYFDYWYPSINTLAADSAPSQERENQILIISRTSDKHKGTMDILEIMTHALENFTLKFLVGGGSVDDQFRGQILTKAGESGIRVEFKCQLNDLEKFIQLKRSKLMLFPSYFEGYGYPAVEALYCDTPCVAYDLPVLRETCGDNIVFAQYGSSRDLEKKVAAVLDRGSSHPQNLKPSVRHAADFNEGVKRLNHILGNYHSIKTGHSKFVTFLRLRRLKTRLLITGLREKIARTPKLLLASYRGFS
ncbi:MAG: glycosyltransferase family 4 protein [bacterium]|nr:glycosyltransferase family 4 protein [bacterium]